jgi:hypothetical protein
MKTDGCGDGDLLVSASRSRQENPAMLVVTSNWCVPDGTLSAGLPRKFIDRFRAEIRKASLRGGVRRDGSYRPVDAIDIVLAGDTFDWLVSREWTGAVRPWDAGRRAAAARERVVLGAMRRGHRLLATLAGWIRRGIEVPLADRRGRPMPTVSRSVPVRVAVLSGDRDRWLEQAVGGWMRSAGAPLPSIGRCWSDGEVVVRHGEELDPLSAACASEPTLGESLAVDLIARFAVAIDELAGLSPLAPGLVRQLAGGRLIDTPTRLIGWLSAHDGRSDFPLMARQPLIDAWHRSVAMWHRTARRLPSGGAVGVDLVDQLADWMELTGCGKSPPWPFQPRSGVNFRSTGATAGNAEGFLGRQPPLSGGGAATTVVLGHPAADTSASAAWRDHVVCLGPGDLHPGDHLGDHLGAPRAVLVQPSHERRQVEWLPLGSGAPQESGQDDEHLVRGVWLSAVRHGAAGIVDAA